jgi:hypothetical protein
VAEEKIGIAVESKNWALDPRFKPRMEGVRDRGG